MNSTNQENTVERKYLASKPVTEKDGIIMAQLFATTHSYDEKIENELRVHACRKNKNNDGWLEMTVYKHHDKQTRQQSISMNRVQAAQLRDLLNAMLGNFGATAAPEVGSMYIGLQLREAA